MAWYMYTVLKEGIFIDSFDALLLCWRIVGRRTENKSVHSLGTYFPVWVKLKKSQNEEKTILTGMTSKRRKTIKERDLLKNLGT